MKIFFVLVLICTPTVGAICQQSSDWMKYLENPESAKWELTEGNKLSNYTNQDFSELLTPKTKILGYIGSNFRRIDVKFSSVRKSSNLKNIYYVSGSTTVSNNTCDFEGMIAIEQVREFKKLHLGVDDVHKDKGIQKEGLLIARFEFAENPEQKHVGIFNGIMTAWWYLDGSGKVQYDNLENESDGFKNNQYVGTWREYGESDEKICNWGEYRIPFSGDLDIGAGEFSANPKYYKMGWSN